MAMQLWRAYVHIVQRFGTVLTEKDRHFLASCRTLRNGKRLIIEFTHIGSRHYSVALHLARQHLERPQDFNISVYRCWACPEGAKFYGKKRRKVAHFIGPRRRPAVALASGAGSSPEGGGQLT